MTKKEKIKRQVITALCIACLIAGAWYYTRITGGYSGEHPSWVYIPADATNEQVADSLRSSLGKSFGGRVALLWGKDVARSHGAYLVAPGEKVWRVARRIERGQQTPVKVTFNNIRTINDLANRIAAQMDFTPEEFLEATTRTAQTDSISSNEIEAQFLPDTYEAYWSDSPDKLIRKIRNHYHNFWTTERLAKAEAEGLTPLQISTLASIVETESNKTDERPTIARLYMNRLKRGMKLQADPTVKYATGDFGAKRITAEMLNVQSPYNTYICPGLPPGIIRMPQAGTLDQVLDAPQHNYLYMCARPDLSGYHNFTSDYSTHMANARAFRKAAYGK